MLNAILSRHIAHGTNTQHMTMTWNCKKKSPAGKNHVIMFYHHLLSPQILLIFVKSTAACGTELVLPDGQMYSSGGGTNFGNWSAFLCSSSISTFVIRFNRRTEKCALFCGTANICNFSVQNDDYVI